VKLALAALSARALAEAAAADGLEAIALDVFGDADTRRAARKWLRIGSRLSIDPEAFVAALVEAAADGATGWVAGAGFEADPALLARGAALLPLVGTAPEVVRAVREPRRFFAALDRHAIAHPAVRRSPPDALDGWLAKSAYASGGWHIRRGAREPAEGRYWQREVQGCAMSALFVADRRSFVLVGCSRQIVRPIGASPYVYCGAIGPLALDARVHAALERALEALVAEFALCGLASLDFIVDRDKLLALEVNPRPPASIALFPRGIMRVHVDACLDAKLPVAVKPPDRVRGTEIVYAPARFALTSPALARLAALAHCHDVPFDHARFERDDPVCSVSAEGADAAEVATMLEARRDAVLRLLELQ